MNRINLAMLSLILSFMLHGEAQAAMPTHHGSDAPLTEGVVKKVDKAASKVTLSHGPLPNGMPAMTMDYKVKNTSRLERINAGQKVRFAADEEMTIVRLETAK